jgi:hypothetical protein
MGSAYSLTYSFNQTDYASGDFNTHEHTTTLYYCGLVTWQEHPCDDDIFNGVWTVLIGFISIFLLVVVSAWACTPLPSERKSYYYAPQHAQTYDPTPVYYDPATLQRPEALPHPNSVYPHAHRGQFVVTRR